MQFGFKLAFAALGGLSLLAGCQSAESVDNPAATDQSRETTPAENQSRYTNGASQLIKPDEATLKAFLSKREFVEPDLEVGLTDQSIPDPSTPDHAGHVHSTVPAAKTAALQTCTVDFNNSTVLGVLPNKAWDSFAYSPHYNFTCASRFWVYTLPQTYNHYHLSYQDPWVCPDYGTPKRVGRYSALPKRAPNCGEWQFGTCNYNTTDPATLPRQMHPHDKTEWVKTYVIDANTRARRTFNLKSVYLPPNDDPVCAPEYGKIQLWIKVAATQQWYYWTWINPGWTFTPAPGDIQNGLDEIQITSASQYGWKVDDIKIDVQY